MAVIRAESAEIALKTADACVAGGLRILEFTFTTPGAPALIRAALERFGGSDVLVGAGSVLEAETARVALLEGAQFVVAPVLAPEMMRLCHRCRVVGIPGAHTATEVVACLEAGTDLIKLFPSESGGPALLRALHGPLPMAPLMPTGGITVANLNQWWQAGAVALGLGGSLTASAANGDFGTVEKRSREFVAALEAARKEIHE